MAVNGLILRFTGLHRSGQARTCTRDPVDL